MYVFNNKHPNNTGDLMPLFSNNGSACSVVMYNKFTTQDITNKAIIIHKKPEDFKSQTCGNSGNRIACGLIKR